MLSWVRPQAPQQLVAGREFVVASVPSLPSVASVASAWIEEYSRREAL